MGGIVPEEKIGLITEFCPYCRRPLVIYEPDSTRIEVLYPQAAMSMVARVDPETGIGIGVPVPRSSYCLRRLCRLRRWRHERKQDA